MNLGIFLERYRISGNSPSAASRIYQAELQAYETPYKIQGEYENNVEQPGIQRKRISAPSVTGVVRLDTRAIVEFEGADQMQLQFLNTPHPVDEAVAGVHMSRHGFARPMGRFVHIPSMRRSVIHSNK